MCASGDITLGTNLDTTWEKLGARRLRENYNLSAEPDSLVAPLRPMYADADVLVLNVETAIGTGPTTTKCGPRSRNCYAFRAHPSAAAALRSLGSASAVVVGNVANNHARDAGDSGVDSTINYLAAVGVHATGRDTLATPVVLPDGTVLAVLGFYAGDMLTDARQVAAVRRHVARAARMYGTVIVTAHIGAEGIGAQRTRARTELFLSSKINRGNPVAFADSAFAGGASVVFGHGPHVLRAAEWRDKKVVFHSLGNLLTYGPFSNGEPLNRGAVACVELSGRDVVKAEIKPTVQRAPGVVAADPARRANKLIDSLSRLDFPRTGARVTATGEVVPAARPTASPR